MSTARTITARFAGSCVECGADVAVGDTVHSRRGAGVTCAACPAPEAIPGATRAAREARVDRLRGWAEKREVNGDAKLATAHELAHMIPFGQPIMVGHYSERSDRNRRDRIGRKMDAGIADHRKADSMNSRAANIEHQAAVAIYDDDVDAVARLAEKIGRLTAARDEKKADNAAYRKAHRAELAGLTAYGRDQVLPYASWEITNLTANIARLKKRLAALTRDQEAT